MYLGLALTTASALLATPAFGQQGWPPESSNPKILYRAVKFDADDEFLILGPCRVPLQTLMELFRTSRNEQEFPVLIEERADFKGELAESAKLDDAR